MKRMRGLSPKAQGSHTHTKKSLKEDYEKMETIGESTIIQRYLEKCLVPVLLTHWAPLSIAGLILV